MSFVLRVSLVNKEKLFKKVNAKSCSEMDMLYLSLPEMISTSLKWTEDKRNSNVVTESPFRRQCKQIHNKSTHRNIELLASTINKTLLIYLNFLSLLISLQCRGLRLDSWVLRIRWRRDRLPTPVFLGFPCGSVSKESAWNTRDLGSIPGLGRSPGEGKGYPLQYSGLENSMDCIVHGVAKSRTQLSGHNWATFTFPRIRIEIHWSNPDCTCH